MELELGAEEWVAGEKLRGALRLREGGGVTAAYVWLEGKLDTHPDGNELLVELGRTRLSLHAVTNDRRLVFELALPYHPTTFRLKLLAFEWKVIVQVITARGEWLRLSQRFVLRPLVVADDAPAPPRPVEPTPPLRLGVGYREAARLPAEPPSPPPADEDTELGRVARARSLADLTAIFAQQDAEGLALVRRRRGAVDSGAWALARSAGAWVFGLGMSVFFVLAAVVTSLQSSWLWSLVMFPVAGIMAFGALLFARSVNHIAGEATGPRPDVVVPWAAALGEQIAVRVRGDTHGEVELRCVEARAHLHTSPRRYGGRAYWSWETSVVHSSRADLVPDADGNGSTARLTVPRHGVPTLRHVARNGVSWSIVVGTRSVPLYVLPARTEREPKPDPAAALPPPASQATAPRAKRRKKKRR